MVPTRARRPEVATEAQHTCTARDSTRGLVLCRSAEVAVVQARTGLPHTHARAPVRATCAPSTLSTPQRGLHVARASSTFVGTVQVAFLDIWNNERVVVLFKSSLFLRTSKLRRRIKKLGKWGRKIKTHNCLEQQVGSYPLNKVIELARDFHVSQSPCACQHR